MSKPTGADVDGPKTLAEGRAWMHDRLVCRTHPMNALPPPEGAEWIDGLPGLDGASWGTYWGCIGDEDAVAAAERAGDLARAVDLADAAHLGNVQQPTAFTEIVRRFIGSARVAQIQEARP